MPSVAQVDAGDDPWMTLLMARSEFALVTAKLAVPADGGGRKSLGRDIAEFVRLGMEYDPQPPFGTGSPGRAGACLTNLFTTVTTPVFHSWPMPRNTLLTRHSAQ